MEKRRATIVLAVVIALFALTVSAYAGPPDGPPDHPKGRPTETPPRGKPSPSGSATPTVTPTPTESPTVDPTPSACDDGSAGYDLTGGGAEYLGPLLHVTVESGEPSCPDVSYVLYVLDGLQPDTWAAYRQGQIAGLVTGEAPDEPARDGALLIEPEALSGNGTTELEYTLVVPDDDPSVCIYSEAIKDGFVLDRAYDDGCMDVDFLNQVLGPGRSYD